MTPGEMTATLNGSDTHITLSNLECMTSFFGMQVFDSQFLHSLMGSANYRSDGHRNIVAAKETVANKLIRIQAFFGGKDNCLVSRLGRMGSTQCYVESCELMLEALADAGVMGQAPDSVEGEWSEESSESSERISANE